MFNLANLLEEKRNKILTQVAESYIGLFGESQRNEDVIVWKDGSITTNSYAGSIDYRNDNIAFVYSCTGQSAQNWHDLFFNGVTEEMQEELDRRGWFSLYEGTTENIADWKDSDRYEIDSSDYEQEWGHDVDNAIRVAIENEQFQYA